MIAVSRGVSESSSLRDIKDVYFKQGTDVVNVPPLACVCSGFVKAVKNRNVQLEGIVAAHGTAGGEASAETFAALKQMLLSGFKKAGRVDAVLPSLDGAMASEGETHADGLILAEVRRLVGKDLLRRYDWQTKGSGHSWSRSIGY